jgi:hypothetical protein
MIDAISFSLSMLLTSLSIKSISQVTVDVKGLVSKI